LLDFRAAAIKDLVVIFFGKFLYILRGHDDITKKICVYNLEDKQIRANKYVNL